MFPSLPCAFAELFLFVLYLWYWPNTIDYALLRLLILFVIVWFFGLQCPPHQTSAWAHSPIHVRCSCILWYLVWVLWFYCWLLRVVSGVIPTAHATDQYQTYPAYCFYYFRIIFRWILSSLGSRVFSWSNNQTIANWDDHPLTPEFFDLFLLASFSCCLIVVVVRRLLDHEYLHWH